VCSLHVLLRTVHVRLDEVGIVVPRTVDGWGDWVGFHLALGVGAEEWQQQIGLGHVGVKPRIFIVRGENCRHAVVNWRHELVRRGRDDDVGCVPAAVAIRVLHEQAGTAKQNSRLPVSWMW